MRKLDFFFFINIRGEEKTLLRAIAEFKMKLERKKRDGKKRDGKKSWEGFEIKEKKVFGSNVKMKR